MLVITGNGWPLSSSRFIAKRREEYKDAATVNYLFIRDTTDLERNHAVRAEQQQEI